LLPAHQLDRVDIVLVSPRNPLNIGAAARAMANFGFRRLSIVAPFATNWMEAKSAVGAPDLLREAKVYDTLAEALAPATLVLGTGSLDRRRPEQAILGLPQAARQTRHALSSESDPSHVAILFGSEKHGLTTEDLSWCHGIIVIDTADAQPSINLGQAVAITLYELSRDAVPSSPDPIQPILNLTSQPQTEQLERLAGIIEETMDAANYMTRGMRSANGEALRVLLRRLMPQDADLRRIMGLFRRILYQLHRPPKQ
jgi:TrmH family RNA methyltransferase